MPTETFHNLPAEKRQRFIAAAMDEFAGHNYDAASINRIIKELGIARGSVYQYFTDKLDLWLYLKEYAETEKLKHIRSVDRQAFPDFWSYYRALYTQGLEFVVEQPSCSRFLYRLGYKETSGDVSAYLHSWKAQAKEQFAQWVQTEISSGSIRRDLPADIVVHFMMTMGTSLTELLQDQYGILFEENLQKGRLFLDKQINDYIAAVNNLITLMESALKPQV